MSINFDTLSYCSLYGSTRVVRPFMVNDDVTSQSLTISGSLGSTSSTNYSLSFEYGVPYDPPFPGDPDNNGIQYPTFIPNPTIAAYVSNVSNVYYLVGSNPRPLIVGSDLGNLNLNISFYQNTATSSSPCLFSVQFDLYNPYPGTATITPTTINCIAYGLSSS